MVLSNVTLTFRTTTGATCQTPARVADNAVQNPHHLLKAIADNVSNRPSTEIGFDLLVPAQSAKYWCPRCRLVLHAKRTLVRHYRTVHTLSDESPFECTACGAHFKRKDVLDRHQRTQHEHPALVECESCHKRIRPRALRQHRTSQACLRTQAQISADDSMEVFKRKAFKAFAMDKYFTTDMNSIPGYLPAVYDIFRLSVELMAKLRPWGKGHESSAIWRMESLITEPSLEVLELQGLMYRMMYKAAFDYDPCRDAYVLEAIIMLNIVTFMMGGWEAVAYHRQVIHALEHQAVRSLGRQRDFAGAGPAEAFRSVVASSDVSVTDVSKCWQATQAALEMVRAAAVELIIDTPPEDMSTAAASVTLEQFISLYKPRLIYMAEAISTVHDLPHATR